MDGLYTFNAMTRHKSYHPGKINLCINGLTVAMASRENAGPDNIMLLATLQLNKDDEIALHFEGHFYDLNKRISTFFEGRLLSVLDE